MKRRKVSSGSWRDYEAYKASWIAQNPAATPEQYEAAMARIARLCGV